MTPERHDSKRHTCSWAGRLRWPLLIGAAVVAAAIAALAATGAPPLSSSRHADHRSVADQALRHVARIAYAGGCVLPNQATLQPYRCGGDYAGAFNQRIPAGAPSDPHSRQMVADMVRSMRRIRMGLDDSDGTPGVWVARPHDPVWTIVSSGRQRPIRFRIPARARPAAGVDAPLLVFDPSSLAYGHDVELRLWRAIAHPSQRTIDVTNYGLFRYDRASNGLPFDGVGTGYGLSWAGLIRAWEVRQGAIDHALRATAPIDSIAHRLPAISSDCRVTAINTCSGLIAEGLRLQLNPSVKCATRTVPFPDPHGNDTRFLHEICRALQVYGMILVDGSGDPNLYSLEMEQGTRYGGTADWLAFLNRPPGGFWGNIIRDSNANATGDGVPRNSTTGIPWDQMRVLAASVFATPHASIYRH